ncbi:IS4 family transposase [Nonomuraea sp. M3C6]|uniref:IS4 family transposase n=1 Tax=Nonomuraea marmarensis TaxID=3351344 RepID=A0ABW7AV74_9ACTN
MFAPGHLGELTQYLPFELVDAVLEETGRVERRLRDLPSRVGVYFVLAMSLYPGLGYLQVWRKVIAGLSGLAVPVPTAKALRDLRRRVGEQPIAQLFAVVAGPLAQRHTPGVRFGRWRTVSFDGCTSIKAPDSGRNVGWLRKATAALGVTGYPMVEVMTLVETGTRALLGAVFGPTATSETQYATRLLHLLSADMLVLADRGFDATAFLEKLAATKAQFLVRLRASRRPPIICRLSDGSVLARFGTLTVRIITADVTVTCADGTTWTACYRLVTTLTDHRRHQATALIRLYHERWEHEVTYLAIRHTLLQGRVLRSRDPVGLRQELWALLTLYQLLRIAMVEAIEHLPGTDPDRAPFTTALLTAQDLLVKAENVIPDDHVTIPGRIGHAVLEDLAPPRRPRVSVRKIKSPLSRWNKADPHRPRTSTPITNITINSTGPAPTHQQTLTARPEP